MEASQAILVDSRGSTPLSQVPEFKPLWVLFINQVKFGVTHRNSPVEARDNSVFARLNFARLNSLQVL